MPAWAARSRQASASRQAQASASAGAGPWQLAQPGGAAASHGVAPTQSAPTQTAPSQPVAACTALVRLVSDEGPGPGGRPPLLQGECWIAVDLGTTTLGGLMQQIGSTLRRGRHRCRWLRSPLQLHLMDTLSQQVALPPAASGQLLRELGWVQAETLKLVVATVPPNGGTATSSKDVADTLHVLVLREDQLPSPPDVQMGAQVPVAPDDSPTEAEVAEPSRPLGATRVSSASSLTGLTLQRSERCPAQDRGTGGPAQSSDPVGASPPLMTATPLLMTATPPLCPQATPRLSPAPSDSLSILTLPFVGDGPAAQNLGFHRARGPWQQMTPHYAPRLLRASRQARQFEFHPTLPNVLLVGETSGGVTVTRTDEFVDEAVDEQVRRPPLIIERSQVLGLSWMRHHPQVALCGVANSGRISFLRYDPMAGPRERALEEISGAGSFNAPLSSLSVNCSDDFLLASGSSCDVAIYDTQTGCSLQRGIGVHSHLINISRFAHGAPHIFATASLDHTCKVWDLRTKLTRERPVSILRTRGPNVMCAFSPDDRRLMCSGIGDDLTQFDVPSWQMFDKFPCRTPDRSPYMGKRFRRATYLANSHTFVTGATGESHVRFLSCDGKDYGVVDFCSLRRHFRRMGPSVGATAASILGGLTAKAQAPEFNYGHTLGASVQRAAGREPLRRVTEGMGLSSRSVVQSGETQLDLTGANGVSVQSVKANPIIENQVGVLLSSDLSDPQSYVALLHLAPNFDSPSFDSTG
jgi:hypothetical protein